VMKAFLIIWSKLHLSLVATGIIDYPTSYSFHVSANSAMFSTKFNVGLSEGIPVSASTAAKF
jgi:hypothetical protein